MTIYVWTINLVDGKLYNQDTPEEFQVMVKCGKYKTFTCASLAAYFNLKYQAGIPPDAVCAVFPLYDTCPVGLIGTAVGFLSGLPNFDCGYNLIGTKWNSYFVSGKEVLVSSVVPGGLEIKQRFAPCVNPKTGVVTTHIESGFNNVIGSCGFKRPLTGYTQSNGYLNLDKYADGLLTASDIVYADFNQ